MGKSWTAADLPAGAIGYGSPYGADPGDLYAMFKDGTYQLLEKGFSARIMAEAIAANKIADAQNAARAAAVSATPATPAVAVSSTTSSSVKMADPDIILFDDTSVSVQGMTDLFIEDIAGQELINIARTDTVNGQNISYQPIKNLNALQQEYNPNNILRLQSTSDVYFQNYPIKFENKVPNIGNGPSGAYVYMDQLTGDIIIETVNMEDDEQVEVAISLNGIIYEAEL